MNDAAGGTSHPGERRERLAPAGGVGVADLARHGKPAGDRHRRRPGWGGGGGWTARDVFLLYVLAKSLREGRVPSAHPRHRPVGKTTLLERIGWTTSSGKQTERDPPHRRPEHRAWRTRRAVSCSGIWAARPAGPRRDKPLQETDSILFVVDCSRRLDRGEPRGSRGMSVEQRPGRCARAGLREQAGPSRAFPEALGSRIMDRGLLRTTASTTWRGAAPSRGSGSGGRQWLIKVMKTNQIKVCGGGGGLWVALLSPRRPPRGGLGEGRASSPQESDAAGLFYLYILLHTLFSTSSSWQWGLRPRQRPGIFAHSPSLSGERGLGALSSSSRELPSPSVAWGPAWALRRKLVCPTFPNTPAALLLSLPSAKCIYLRC